MFRSLVGVGKSVMVVPYVTILSSLTPSGNNPPFALSVIAYVSNCQFAKATSVSPALIVPLATNAPTSHDPDETPVLDIHTLLFLSQIFQAVAPGGLVQPGGGADNRVVILYIFNSSVSMLYVEVTAVPELLPIMPN